MIIIEDTLVSDDVLEAKFVCDLFACKGQCCEAGDYGAPLDDGEIKSIQQNLPAILPYLEESTVKLINQIGFCTTDIDDELCTTLINDKECVFARKNEQDIWKCMIEQAFIDGKSTFRKPISCFLYPVRLKNYPNFIAVNYDKWDVCSPACSNGESLKVPVYKFLKTPLTERFGEEWYKQLSAYAAHKKRGT